MRPLRQAEEVDLRAAPATVLRALPEGGHKLAVSLPRDGFVPLTEEKTRRFTSVHWAFRQATLNNSALNSNGVMVRSPRKRWENRPMD